MSKNNALNTHRDEFTHSGMLPAASNGHVPKKPGSTRFNLASSGGYGFEAAQFNPAIFIGLSSTGTKCAWHLIQMIEAEFGHRPGAAQFLMTDASAKDNPIESEDFVLMTGAIDGGGTDPNVGRAYFLATYSRLRDVLIAKHQQLTVMDPRVPCSHSPEQVTDFVIISGCGSTGGGSLELAITLCHDAARARKIAKARIHVVQVGADIARGDSTRSLSREQSVVITDTLANNLNSLFAEMRDPSLVEFECPNHPSLHMRLSDRIWSLSLIDQSNGGFHFETTGEVLSMIARTVLFGTFTDANSFVNQRARDEIRLGVTGQHIDAD